jgi:hypothetical protein
MLVSAKDHNTKEMELFINLITLVDDPQPMSNMAASAVFTIKIVLKKMVWACVHKHLS